MRMSEKSPLLWWKPSWLGIRQFLRRWIHTSILSMMGSHSGLQQLPMEARRHIGIIGSCQRWPWRILMIAWSLGSLIMILLQVTPKSVLLASNSPVSSSMQKTRSNQTGTPYSTTIKDLGSLDSILGWRVRSKALNKKIRLTLSWQRPFKGKRSWWRSLKTWRDSRFNWLRRRSRCKLRLWEPRKKESKRSNS